MLAPATGAVALRFALIRVALLCQALPAQAGDTPTAITASGWTLRSDWVGSDYRLSLGRGAVDVGLRFDHPQDGSASHASPPTAGPVLRPLPVIDIGVRSVLATKGNSLSQWYGGEATPGPSRRVGVEWKPASQIVFFRQGLGLRLSGDDRVTMSFRRGVLGVYMKHEF